MESKKPETIDRKSGFCSKTKTFHSLKPKAPLPSSHQPLSIAQFSFSLLNSSKSKPELATTKVLINSTTGDSLLYSDFIGRVNSLALSIKSLFPSLKQNDVAFILLPSSFHVPVIYFSLFSLGIIISPSNPLGSDSEVAHQLELSKPKLAFATSATAHKLKSSYPHSLSIILIDSPEFQTFLNFGSHADAGELPAINQSDMAVILYSSGTTGRVKGVPLTHRNLIALTSGLYHNRFQRTVAAGGGEPVPEPHPLTLFTLPLFHVFGLFMLVRAVAAGETVVLMERFDFEEMLRAVERYKVTYMPVSPPLIVALVKSELTKKYDLSSLLLLGSGGAPLGKEVANQFKEKFPNIEITQVRE